MIDAGSAFSSFSVDDVDRAAAFYRDTLGLTVDDTDMGFLQVHVGGTSVMVYPKGEGHSPASFTVLNFPVASVEAAVDDLTSRGVKFVKYPGTNDKGISSGEGPTIAWFTDPAGNVMSVLEDGR